MNAVEPDAGARSSGTGLVPLSYARPADPIPTDPEINDFAIASMMCGLFVCVPFIAGAMALIFGIAVLGRSRPRRPIDLVLAIGGTTLGAVSLAMWMLYVVVGV